MKLLLPLLLFSFTTLTAQTNIDIVGRWKVVALVFSDGLPTEDLQAYKAGEKILLQSKFDIKADHHFDYTTPDKDMNIINARWTYDAANKGYLVDEWNSPAPSGELMAFRVILRSDKVHFLMDDGDMVMSFIVERE